MMTTLSRISVAASLLFAACTTSGDASDTASVAQHATVAVSTDATSYAPGTPIVVSFDGLPGDPTDWISIASEGSCDCAFTAWKYTDGSQAGRVTFEGSLPAGNYVARAYPLDGWELWGESIAFTVEARGEAVSTDKLVYSAHDPIIVNYAGFTGDPTNWITVAPAAADSYQYGEWFYTSGNASGRMQFASLPAGDYEVRAFVADGFDEVAHASFHVTGDVLVAPEQESFVAGDDVSVEYFNLPGNELDWIAIAPVGSDDASYTAWTYTGGNTNGAATFSHLPAGSYVVRAYANDGWDRLAESPAFTVVERSVSLTLDKTTYTSSDTITVTFDGFTTGQQDWITIVPADAPNDTYLEWHYNAGATRGSMTFLPVAPGTYEVRAYLNDGFERVGTAQITVAD